ncbi:MAG: choice-of-anchor L domain-containing protein, partial [Microcystaceae cyanobacterium]
MANAFDLASAILGPGVTITSATFTGDPQSAAVFSASDPSPGIGIASGIVLSTGNVADIYGPNDSDNTSTDFPTAGDVDLDALVTPSATQDAAVLEFDFVPTANFLTFNYVFASEEYNEWVGSSFNDVFGFFVTDPAGVTTNIAVIPGTTTPIAVNNVNSLSNPAYYLNNDPTDFGFSTTPHNTEFDGFTTGLTAAIQVIPGEIYKFKLAIADNSDGIYDSAVFITNESFVSLPLVPVTDSFLVSSDSPTSLDVLANDLVLEGEQPFIESFDPLSNNGGTVDLNDNQTPDDPLDDKLIYTSQSGFSGLDSFNYTLADSIGNTATGTVYIQVDNATPPPPPSSVYYLTTATSWTDAQAQAQIMGGNLVTINDATENQFLINAFAGEQFWIGYTDQAEEGLWQWISGETSSYTNWSGGEPNNYGEEDYAVTNWVSPGTWNDLANYWYYSIKGIVEVVGGTSTLSVGDVSVAENGTHEVLVPVTLNGITDQTFTVDYS